VGLPGLEPGIFAV